MLLFGVRPGIAVVLCAAALSASIALSPASATYASWPAGATQVKVDAERVSGRTRFETAVAIARAAYPGWGGVGHVIIVSGEDRSFPDPLAAASLSWAYDAPILLTARDHLPASVALALREIASVTPTVTVHVVGGATAVPAGRLADIRSAIGSTRVEQPWLTGDRYDLARGIAHRSRTVAAASGKVAERAVFLANGADPRTSFDALSLSALSAATGIPILLVSEHEVPAATTRALREIDPVEVIVAGGPATISPQTYRRARATARWAGATRYATSP